MILFTDNPPLTKFDMAQQKIDKVKVVLVENIEAVVKRYGQIEITLDETQSLKDTSAAFATSSKRVKQTAQCQLYKTYAIGVGVLLVIIGIIVAMICINGSC